MQIDSIIKDSDEIPEEQAIEVIEKAKVEDDEYKDQTGEQNYYGSVKIMPFLLISLVGFGYYVLQKKQSTCLLFFQYCSFHKRNGNRASKYNGQRNAEGISNQG